MVTNQIEWFGLKWQGVHLGFYQWHHWHANAIQDSAVGAIGGATVPMVPILLTFGCQFWRQPRAWAKLPTRENEVIQNGVESWEEGNKDIKMKANEKKMTFCLSTETTFQHVSTVNCHLHHSILPMVPLVNYQWYHGLYQGTTGSTNGTIGCWYCSGLYDHQWCQWNPEVAMFGGGPLNHFCKTFVKISAMKWNMVRIGYKASEEMCENVDDGCLPIL